MSKGKAREEALEAWTWMISLLNSLEAVAEVEVVKASISTSSKEVLVVEDSSSKRKFRISSKTQM